jgi:hypothetical protein
MNNLSDNNQDSLSSEIAIQTPIATRFDFATEKKKKSKLVPILIILLSIGLIIIGYFGSAQNVATPEILPVIENRITNDEVVFSSNKAPFYVTFNGNTTFASKRDNLWSVNLGQVDGKIDYKLGGYYDLGAHKILGTKSKTVTLERDFTAPQVQVIAPQYSDSNILNFTLDFQKQENVKIKYLDKLIYAKDDKNSTCVINDKRTEQMNCKIDLGPTKDANFSLTVTDELNNQITTQSKNVKVVDPLKLECDENKIINTGVINCSFNRNINGKFILDDKTIELKNTKVIEHKIENPANKGYKINIKGTDEFNFSQEFVKDIVVDTEPFEASMWVEQSANRTKTEYNVYARANKDSDFEAYYQDTIHTWADDNSPVVKKPGNSGRAKVFQRSDLPKNQTVLVKQSSTVGIDCHSYCVERVYSINLHPVNDPNKIIVYTCTAGIDTNLISSCKRK